MDVQKTEHGRTENRAWTYRKQSMRLREKRIFSIRAGCKVVARNAERNSIKGRKRVVRKDE